MAAIRYTVLNFEEAVTFYTEKPGFALIENWGGAYAMVSREDLNLWLSGPGSSAARQMTDGRQPDPGGWNRFVI